MIFGSLGLLQPEPAWGFGLGGALFLVSVTTAWASLHLRGKTHSRLRKEVDLAYAGLSELAVTKLRELQEKLTDLLPLASAGFDPMDLIVDPAQVSVPAKQSIRILRQRSKITNEFESLLCVCSIAPYVAISFTGLVLVSTFLYFVAFENFQLWQSSCYLSVAVAILGVIVFAIYAALNSRVQRAIEAAHPLDHHEGKR